jgi:exodeoxyribonuclease VII large subunit
LLVAEARQHTDEAFVRLERALVARQARGATVWRGLRERLLETGRLYCGALERRLDGLEIRMHDAFSHRRERASTEFATLRSKLDALSPLAVLDRGYSLVSRADGSFVRAAGEIRPGETLDLRFRRGRARATVVDVAANGGPGK